MSLAGAGWDRGVPVGYLRELGGADRRRWDSMQDFKKLTMPEEGLPEDSLDRDRMLTCVSL